MINKDEWVKVGGIVSDSWDYKTDKTVTGVYVEKRTNVGPNNSNCYILEKEDGKRISVWGSAILDSRFQGVTIGEELKIEYLGKAKSEKTGREYHSFELWHHPISVWQAK